MVLLTSCATIRRLQARDTEELLTAAGFKKQLVDAADTKPLDATPPYRLVSRTKDGTVQYTYADPDNCRCVYVGDSKEYAEYQRRNADWMTSGGAPPKTCGTGIPGDHSRREIDADWSPLWSEARRHLTSTLLG